ncbi:hypothetical protein [Streptomyces geranii]|nr:hypothetical protein [Streptomyces geranii]
MVLALLAAVVAKFVWWVVAPTLPYIGGGLLLVSIFGVLFYRKTRW